MRDSSGFENLKKPAVKKKKSKCEMFSFCLMKCDIRSREERIDECKCGIKVYMCQKRSSYTSGSYLKSIDVHKLIIKIHDRLISVLYRYMKGDGPEKENTYATLSRIFGCFRNVPKIPKK